MDVVDPPRLLDTLRLMGHDHVSDLTSGQREILEQWATAVRENQAGSAFSIDEEAKHRVIGDRLSRFLDDPSEETFETLWNTIYSSQRAGNPGYLPNNKLIYSG